MEIEIAPTGKLVEGTIFDCNKKGLERALKSYDKQLYLKWNPKKNNGYGLWELRRRPNHKLRVDHGEFDGIEISSLQYKENDMIHHVLDMPYLTYDVIDRLREMDAWANPDMFKQMDEKAEAYLANERKKIREDRRAALREDKKYIQEFREAVRSGYNPAWFLSSHRKPVK